MKAFLECGHERIVLTRVKDSKYYCIECDAMKYPVSFDPPLRDIPKGDNR